MTSAANAWRRHWLRTAVTLVPVALAVLHAAGIWRLPFLDRLDHFIYDVRLRATMPRTLDPRIVIVDIDDASLQRLGQWPWSRDKLARLTDELVGRQRAAAVGFDVLFVEADGSSGLDSLRRLAAGTWRDVPGFSAEVERLAPTLDHDAAFAHALAGRPVALGYYFTQTVAPRAVGRLPAPLLPIDAAVAPTATLASWNGFGANIPLLSQAAPAAGFLNMTIDAEQDGVVRAVPLLARYDGPAAVPGYYESLSLTLHRLAFGRGEAAQAGFAPAAWPGRPPTLQALFVSTPGGRMRIPVDARAHLLVPFRGPGGAQGGSFRYIAAADVLDGALAQGELAGKIVLVGASAPGLQDLRPTPVGAAFPGVEVHANVLSAVLDGRLPRVPDEAAAFEVAMLAVLGVLLAIGLSLCSAPRAIALASGAAAALVAFNVALHVQTGIVLPLATSLAMVALAFVFNISWAYFIEARASRGLAELFGTYVPPQLVDEMLADPTRYSMRAESKRLTVMFCDMRGFTRLSEQLAPTELQTFLNALFSRLTEIINVHRGTVDKYMGDCVMAFWGAPVEAPDHAELAVDTALRMAASVRQLNDSHRAAGRPEISVGIGLNTGVMSVGDMGSAVRRSYTVIGDAVNLASRLEALNGYYGVEIVAGAATHDAAPGFVWQELDLVRVKGRAQAVRIFTPLGRIGDARASSSQDELARWDKMLLAYRAQSWSEARRWLAPLLESRADNVLYRVYAQRLASMAGTPFDPAWDPAIRFESK